MEARTNANSKVARKMDLQEVGSYSALGSCHQEEDHQGSFLQDSYLHYSSEVQS